MSSFEGRLKTLEQVFCPEEKRTVEYVYGMNTDFWYVLDDDGNKVEITDKHPRNITYLEPEDRFT